MRSCRRRQTCARVLVMAATGVTLAACADSNVPFFTAPVSVPNSPQGIQNSINGLFSAIRFDQGDYVVEVAAGYARDGSVYTNTEARTVEYPLGVFPEPSSWANDWPQEYQNIAQANATLAAIPKVLPAYSAAEAEGVWGVIETLKAMNYMIVAETHDTLGLDIQPYPDVTPPALPPAVCFQDGWKYIVSMLDSAEDSLAKSGPTSLTTVVTPKGFAGVNGAAGPSTQLGSFASFNRILAAKAYLELAYAIARSSPATAPTPTLPGSPDAASLASALAALDASAMWDPTGASLEPNAVGSFTADSRDVMDDFSAVSGDFINQIFNQIGTIAQLNDFTATVDTVNDLRWKAKFITNPNPVQQQLYNPTATITKLDPATGRDTTWSYLYNMSGTPSSPVPIVREESMTFWAAEIQMGMGNYTQALAYVNNVRTKVGGLTAYPASDASTFVQTRNDLMADQRISTTWEASLDRVIAIRMYGLAAVADTTWGVNGVLPHGGTEDPAVHVTDSHTTVEPIPSAELNGRGGTYTTSCPTMTAY